MMFLLLTNMDLYHILLSCLLAVASFMATYLFTSFSRRIENLEKAHTSTNLLLVGQYITRQEFKSEISEIFLRIDSKLVRIEGKIDNCGSCKP